MLAPLKYRLFSLLSLQGPGQGLAFRGFPCLSNKDEAEKQGGAANVGHETTPVQFRLCAFTSHLSPL